MFTLKSSCLHAFALGAVLVSAAPLPKRASCTISSYDSSVSGCSSVTINAFTVPSGKTVSWSFADGASVKLNGDITFSKTTASGPLITFDGDDVTFSGSGHTLNGNGAEYWDGKGTNGGVTKPHPFLKVKGSGTYSDFTVLNTPAQAISVGGSSLVFDTITVDNSAGDENSLGHNTDGFDVSADDITIKNSVVKNQDDCIAINKGTSITFENNQCSGGHGMSIGSIASDHSVSGVTFSGNTVSNSMYGIRIKVDSDASDASVSDVTYSGNTLTGIDKYGVLISESYPDDDSTPGTGATISDVNFTGATTSVTVTGSSGKRLAVDCGNCSGNWNFSSLKITGGSAGTLVTDDAKISGGSY